MRRTTGLPFLGGRFNPIRPSAPTTIALKGGESGYTLLLLRRVIYHDNLIGETRRADGHVSGHGWELTLRRKFRLEVEPPFSYGSSVDPEEPFKAPANDNFDDEGYRMCQGVIPNTFIACGEGDDWTRYYCSEACERRDKKRRGIVDC